jgi:hypothetical protein
MSGSFLKARQHISQRANKAMHILLTKTNKADLPPDLIKMFLFNKTQLCLVLLQVIYKPESPVCTDNQYKGNCEAETRFRREKLPSSLYRLCMVITCIK